MTLIDQAIGAVFLLLSARLSGLIGMERERQGQPAGLRTHMLVGVGACLFTQLSLNAFDNGDPARVAAQVVSGIGFLGAGVIVVRGKNPHNLTTAASIWAASAVGMAVGTGAWFLATNATLMMWVILALLRLFSKRDENDKGKKSEEQPIDG